MTRVSVLLALLLGLTAPPSVQPRPPNELGRVMILEYHRIDKPEGRWTRTPENLRRDLATLYARGYRLVRLNDLLDGRIALPAGTTPVVLTFDDSSPGQFRYLARGGPPEIDPRSAVGILEAFSRQRPDFGRGATFYVLPGASRPNRLFDQPEWEGDKLRYLVANGYEIGNHTLWHANLGQYREATVRAQIAEAQRWILRHVPDYRIRTMALPHGVYPREARWVLEGTVNGITYRHDAVMMVAGGAAPSPFARAFDPRRLPRIQAVDREIASWLAHFDRHPEERFVSDGDPAVVTIPAGRRDRLRAPLPGHLRVVERYR